MDKEDRDTYTVEYYSGIKRNETMPFAAWGHIQSDTAGDLYIRMHKRTKEIVIVGEVSQTQKRNFVCVHICVESKKKWYKYLFMKQKQTHLENKPMVASEE